MGKKWPPAWPAALTGWPPGHSLAITATWRTSVESDGRCSW
jgi:hypothetical protein